MKTVKSCSLLFTMTIASFGLAEGSLAGDNAQLSSVFIQVGYMENSAFQKTEEGSGFLISPKGWVVTAKHVVEAAIPDGKQRVFYGSVASRTAEKIELFDVPAPVVSADIALLRFSPALPKKWNFLRVLSNHVFSTGEHVVAYGFPLGNEIEFRPGVVSNLLGPKGSIGVNVGLAPGMSGGPVILENTDCVVGTVAGGSGYPSFDYFTPTQLALPVLNVPPAEFVTETVSTGQSPTSPSEGALFDRSFRVDQTKDDHKATSTSQYYDFNFSADPGANIVSARWVEESAASDSDKTLNLSGDRTGATFRFRLESGPFYDQTRGWWHGQVILTEQKQEKSSGSVLSCD